MKNKLYKLKAFYSKDKLSRYFEKLETYLVFSIKVSASLVFLANFLAIFNLYQKDRNLFFKRLEQLPDLFKELILETSLFIFIILTTSRIAFLILEKIFSKEKAIRYVRLTLILSTAIILYYLRLKYDYYYIGFALIISSLLIIIIPFEKDDLLKNMINFIKNRRWMTYTQNNSVIYYTENKPTINYSEKVENDTKSNMKNRKFHNDHTLYLILKDENLLTKKEYKSKKSFSNYCLSLVKPEEKSARQIGDIFLLEDFEILIKKIKIGNECEFHESMDSILQSISDCNYKTYEKSGRLDFDKTKERIKKIIDILEK